MCLKLFEFAEWGLMRDFEFEWGLIEKKRNLSQVAFVALDLDWQESK